MRGVIAVFQSMANKRHVFYTMTAQIKVAFKKKNNLLAMSTPILQVRKDQIQKNLNLKLPEWTAWNGLRSVDVGDVSIVVALIPKCLKANTLLFPAGCYYLHSMSSHMNFCWFLICLMIPMIKNVWKLYLKQEKGERFDIIK